jgi:hypothetical protein
MLETCRGRVKFVRYNPNVALFHVKSVGMFTTRQKVMGPNPDEVFQLYYK